MSNVVNWFEILVAQMDRATTFYKLAMQVSLRRKSTDCAELTVFPHQDPVSGGTLARFDSTMPSAQSTITYLHTNDLAATLERVATAGGQCVSGPLELGQDIDTIAPSTDSEGNRVGLHQSA